MSRHHNYIFFVLGKYIVIIYIKNVYNFNENNKQLIININGNIKYLFRYNKHNFLKEENFESQYI